MGRFEKLPAATADLIRGLLNEGKKVLIAIRDVADAELTIKQREDMIRREFKDKKNVRLMTIPDVNEIIGGPGVGWKLRAIDSIQPSTTIASPGQTVNEQKGPEGVEPNAEPTDGNVAPPADGRGEQDAPDPVGSAQATQPHSNDMGTSQPPKHGEDAVKDE